MSGPFLIVTATAAEARPLALRLDRQQPLELPLASAVTGEVAGVGVALAVLGIGKANTAAGLALAATHLNTPAVVQVGIGGAYAGWAGVELGKPAVASSEVHLDLGVRYAGGFEDLESMGFPLLAGEPPVFNRVAVHERLTRSLAGSSLPVVPFGTAETVSGERAGAEELAERFGVAVESMEGAAAAQICHALGLPFAEIRGISNVVGERDKTLWRIEEALAGAHRHLFEWLESRAILREWH